MIYTPEQCFAFSAIGLCILAAVTWFLYAAVRGARPHTHPRRLNAGDRRLK